MKMRKFEFTDDSVGRTDFLIAYQAFRGVDPDKISKEDRPYLAAAQRVLESVSTAQGNLPEDADEFTVDLRFRKLNDGGGVIEVSQKLHEKIEGWVESAKFQSGFMRAVEDFGDRWSQAEKFDKEDVPGAGPTPIGAGRKRK